jgi:hypothetical protein
MPPVERQRRSRARARALRDAAAKSADHVSQSAAACAPSPAALDFLAGSPEAIAARIFDRVPVDMARGIAMALQQRLMQGGCWPMWRPPIL